MPNVFETKCKHVIKIKRFDPGATLVHSCEKSDHTQNSVTTRDALCVILML